MNPEPMLEYVKEKVNRLMQVSNVDEELIVKLEILKDFKEIYEYDLQNAKLPEPFGYFKDVKEKENFIKKNYGLKILWIIYVIFFLIIMKKDI